MTYTNFAGLEVLEPGDSLSKDGYKFQLLDRFIIDRILKVGAVTHRHDAHAAMANPTTPMTVTPSATGGAIPGGLAITVAYTLIDQDGGETLPVIAAPVSTASGYLLPATMPTQSLSHAAGTLLAGTYRYAVTVSDGIGGETSISPAVSVTVPTGFANNEVTVGGLDTITAASSGGSGTPSWRLWRQQGGGPWYLIATGTTATFLDNGVVGDCTVQPPATNTTKSANSLSVTVPAAGQDAAAVNFNIYASLDGSFLSPALLGTYPVADFDVAQVYTGLALVDGAPPPVSTALPGADLITSADLALNWLPPVTNLAALPSVGNHDGDARITLDTMIIYAWKISGWVEVGGSSATTLNSDLQTASYTLHFTDIGEVVEINSAGATNLTIPPHTSVPFPAGAVIEVFQYGAGAITVVAGAGVTLRSRGGRVATNGQYATIGLRQRAVDEWVLSGDLA